MKKAVQKTRGARNHNPLNIRIGNTWLGEVANPTESEFEQFVSDFYGLRAAFIILRRYIRRYHKDTIRKIISTWAPSTENKTDLYIAFVSQNTSIDPDATIDYADTTQVVPIVIAMAYYESRMSIPYNDALLAYKKA